MGRIRIYRQGKGMEVSPVSATDLKELFLDIPAFLNMLPYKGRENLFYSVAECEKVGRKLVTGKTIVFDIDKCEGVLTQELIDKYVTVFCEHFGMVRGTFPIVSSGHGIHFIIPLKSKHYIRSQNYHQNFKPYYNWMCRALTHEFSKVGLVGKADPNIFDSTRIMRMPLTVNRKPDVPDTETSWIERPTEATWQDHDFDIVAMSGFIEVDEKEVFSDKLQRVTGKVDTPAVLEGCNFLKWCKEKPQEVNEPQWYAELGILARLEGGKALCHEYSKGGSGYDAFETDMKYEQALSKSQGRLCSSINGMWGGCEECPNYGKVRTPLQIKGEGFMATKNTGFHTIKYDSKGNPGKPIPCYSDLYTYYISQHPAMTCNKTERTYNYNGTHWVKVTDAYIKKFAQTNFDPEPRNNVVQEFLHMLKRRSYEDLSGLFEKYYHYTNFHNGVLDTNTGKLYEHSKEFYKTTLLTFDYEPDAVCPTFDKFLDEITEGDKEVQKVILEFMGYSLSGIDSTLGQKALILEGRGANGKSVLMNVLKSLASPDSYSALTAGPELNARFALSGMEHKLFNISEETPARKDVFGGRFKNIVSGGDANMEVKYQTPGTMRHTAKMIVCTNELPRHVDNTDGLHRRLIQIKFRKQFKGDKADTKLGEKMLRERSGIFNRAYLACKEFVARGYRFTEPRTVEEAKRQFRLDTDHLMRFVADCMEYQEDEMAVCMAIYETYTMWAEIENIPKFAVYEKHHMLKELRHYLPRAEFPKNAVWIKELGKQARAIKNYTVSQGVM